MPPALRGAPRQRDPFGVHPTVGYPGCRDPGTGRPALTGRSQRLQLKASAKGVEGEGSRAAWNLSWTLTLTWERSHQCRPAQTWAASSVLLESRPLTNERKNIIFCRIHGEVQHSGRLVPQCGHSGSSGQTGAQTTERVGGRKVPWLLPGRFTGRTPFQQCCSGPLRAVEPASFPETCTSCLSVWHGFWLLPSCPSRSCWLQRAPPRFALGF